MAGRASRAGEEEIAMGLFRRKKKAPLFGGSVEPSCAYCRHNSGSEGQVLCSLRKERKDGSCKKLPVRPPDAGAPGGPAPADLPVYGGGF